MTFITREEASAHRFFSAAASNFSVSISSCLTLFPIAFRIGQWSEGGEKEGEEEGEEEEGEEEEEEKEGSSSASLKRASNKDIADKNEEDEAVFVAGNETDEEMKGGRREIANPHSINAAVQNPA